MLCVAERTLDLLLFQVEFLAKRSVRFSIDLVGVLHQLLAGRLPPPRWFGIINHANQTPTSATAKGLALLPSSIPLKVETRLKSLPTL
jgi:hypothetical protein